MVSFVQIVAKTIQHQEKQNTHFYFSLFQQIKAIADTGCSVIVSGGKVGELAQHFCNKYKILVVRLMSKWDLRRLCRSLGATPLPRIVSYIVLLL